MSQRLWSKILITSFFLPLQAMYYPLSEVTSEMLFDYGAFHIKLFDYPSTWYKITHFMCEELRLLLHTLQFIPFQKIDAVTKKLSFDEKKHKNYNQQFLNALVRFNKLLRERNKYYSLSYNSSNENTLEFTYQQLAELRSLLPFSFNISESFFREIDPQFSYYFKRTPHALRECTIELDHFFCKLFKLFYKIPSLCQFIFYSPEDIPADLQKTLKISPTILLSPFSFLGTRINREKEEKEIKKAQTLKELAPFISNQACQIYFLAYQVNFNDLQDDINIGDFMPLPSYNPLPSYPLESHLLLNMLDQLLVIKSNSLGISFTTPMKKQALYKALARTYLTLRNCFSYTSNEEVDIYAENIKGGENKEWNNLEELKEIALHNHKAFGNILPIVENILPPLKKKIILDSWVSSYLNNKWGKEPNYDQTRKVLGLYDHITLIKNNHQEAAKVLVALSAIS